MDNRRADRVNFFSGGELSSGEIRKDVSVVDISLNGVLLAVFEPDQSLALGAPASVAVRLNDSGMEMIFSGDIARTDGTFVGLVFSDMDLDTATHLRRLIELNTGKAAMVDRSLNELGD